ncbi:glycosyl hydrolase catalytic core-domain-containing protein [Mycena galericulata]|nr:glycosyl hydrolase catalytic core-domain-containing protein [Mycena galericulata]
MKASAACLFILAIVSSSVAAPLTRSSTKRSGPGKRGLCWPFYNAPLDPAKLNDGSGTVNLIYDYETTLPSSSNGNGGLNFIGTQRCLDCDSSPIADLAARQKQNGFSTLFTLNEPDINGITPAQAAAWYIQNINPLPIKKALPAVTASTNPGQGLDWLSQMLAACAGQCFFDYINLHHYGSSFDQFQTYVTAAHAQFPNNQIVITEFALQAPPGGQADQCVFFLLYSLLLIIIISSPLFLSLLPSLAPTLNISRTHPPTRRVAYYKQAIPFLDSSSFVEMYFPFVATSPSLFTANDAAGAQFAGTGSTLYNDDGSVSAVGALLLQ